MPGHRGPGSAGPRGRGGDPCHALFDDSSPWCSACRCSPRGRAAGEAGPAVPARRLGDTGAHALGTVGRVGAGVGRRVRHPGPAGPGPLDLRHRLHRQPGGPVLHLPLRERAHRGRDAGDRGPEGAVDGVRVHLGAGQDPGPGRVPLRPGRGPGEAAHRARHLARDLDAGLEHRPGRVAALRRDRHHGERGLRSRHDPRDGPHRGLQPRAGHQPGRQHRGLSPALGGLPRLLGGVGPGPHRGVPRRRDATSSSRTRGRGLPPGPSTSPSSSSSTSPSAGPGAASRGSTTRSSRTSSTWTTCGCTSGSSRRRDEETRSF